MLDADTYGRWTRVVATAQHADFIDLNEITARKDDALGASAVEPLFGDAHTHTTMIGAVMNAEVSWLGSKPCIMIRCQGLLT